MLANSYIFLAAAIASILLAFLLLLSLLILSLSRHRQLQIRLLEALNELEIAISRLEQHQEGPGISLANFAPPASQMPARE